MNYKTKQFAFAMALTFLFPALTMFAQDTGTYMSSMPTTDIFSKAKIKRWSIGLSGGIMTWHGDIGSHDFIGTIGEARGAGRLYVGYSINPSMSLRAYFLYGGVKGDDTKESKFKLGRTGEGALSKNFRRALNFRSNIIEYGLEAAWTVTNSTHSLYNSRISAYLLAGVGFFSFHPYGDLFIGAYTQGDTINRYYLDVADVNDKKLVDTNGNKIERDGDYETDLYVWKTEGQSDAGSGLPNAQYKLNAKAFSVGGGVKFRLSSSFDLFAEYNFKFTSTDYIDDASDKTHLSVTNDPDSNYVNNPGNYGWNVRRVNHNNNDKYAFTSIGLIYKIGKKSVAKDSWDWYNEIMTTYQGLVDAKKKVDLLQDSDGDGVLDFVDQDNSTAPGVPVSTLGVPMDSDKDGVADYMDKCPFDMPGVKVDANGCTTDSDGDGVTDVNDKEANTPKGALVDVSGREIKLPEMPKLSLDDLYFPNIFFDTGKDNVKFMYYADIAVVARVLKAYPNMKLKIVGSADERGTDAFNLDLSRRRSESVKKILVETHGVDGSRLMVEALGETNPMTKDRTEGALQVNRRVTFVPMK